MSVLTEWVALGTTVLDRVAHTPLLRLEGVQILGKAEWANPSGSLQDRAAARIVADAQQRRLLGPAKGLLDATSGNMGIAYAMFGAALGFRVTLCVSAKVSPEGKRMLAGYGAEVLWTSPADGSDARASC